MILKTVAPWEYTSARILYLLVTILCVAGLTAPAQAPQPGWIAAGPDRTEAEIATTQLVRLNRQYQGSTGAERKSLGERLQKAAAARFELINRLMEEDPGQAIRSALPGPVRASFPGNVQSYIEEQVVESGQVEVAFEDDGERCRLHHTLNNGVERIQLYFADPEAAPRETQSYLVVQGLRLAGKMAVSSQTTGAELPLAAASLSPAIGEQRTLIILVNFQDKAVKPYSVDYARSVAFVTTSDFDRENSSQQTWLAGEVHGWYTIPVSSGVCDTYAIASYARQAAATDGVDLASFNRYVYSFPGNSCGFWGRATVGGNPSEAWINGSFTLKVLGHEMGHNLGLYHSRTAADEYGDTLDIMGNPSAGHFNAFQKERLTWLNSASSPPIIAVQSSGDYFIEPFEMPGSGPKALKILRTTDPSSGARTWYYVECRRAMGFDASFGSNGNVMSGVVVHTGTSSSPDSSYLLDMTPETSTFKDPALTSGSSFVDSVNGITITPILVGDSGATVRVEVASQPCVAASPFLSVSPATAKWGVPGSKLGYVVSVTNKNSIGCSPATFDLGAGVPTGWASAFSSVSLTLNSGANAAADLQVTSAASAADGLYTIPVKAVNRTNSSLGAQGTASYGISTAASLRVATDASVYSAGQMVTVSVSVTSGTVPASGAAVALTITGPDGKQYAKTAVTDGAGNAACKFKLGRKDPAGSYQVNAVATLTTGISTSASTLFQVR